MQDTSVHRIRRLRWQVRTPRADTALAVRASLREWLPDIEAALDAALSRHAGEGEVRHLGSLNLSLRLPGAFSRQDLLRELGTALGQALHDSAKDMTEPDMGPAQARHLGLHTEQPGQTLARGGELTRLLCALQLAREQAPGALREALLQALQHPQAQRSGGWCELNWLAQRWSVPVADVVHWLAWLSEGGLGQAPEAAAEVPRDAGAHVLQEASSALSASQVDTQPAASLSPSGLQQSQAQLLHYLRTGQFDWVLSGLPTDLALAALRDAAGLWVDWGLIPDALPASSGLPARLGALSRWLALLSADQRRTVQQQQAWAQAPLDDGTALPASDLAALWPSLLQTLMDGGPAACADSLHAQALWLDWLASGGASMVDTAQQHWMGQALPWIASWQRQGPSSDVWRALLALGATSRGPTSEVVAHSPARTTDVATEADALHRAPAVVPPEGVRSAHHPSADGDVAGAPRMPFLGKREPATSTGQIVSLAGLVLLHAYLPRCFDALGLYPSGQRGPLAEHLWPRAAAVLHCLATGLDGALECELGLIKPLLGRDERDVLSHALPTLLPHERDEADALLRAVLGHWRALKGTSVAGLRESFLQRRGWLEPRGGASLLRVEPAPYDVLLSSLPWGISLLRLPWMAQPLHVEWSAP